MTSRWKLHILPSNKLHVFFYSRQSIKAKSRSRESQCFSPCHTSILQPVPTSSLQSSRPATSLSINLETLFPTSSHFYSIFGNLLAHLPLFSLTPAIRKRAYFLPYLLGKAWNYPFRVTNFSPCCLMDEQNVLSQIFILICTRFFGICVYIYLLRNIKKWKEKCLYCNEGPFEYSLYCRYSRTLADRPK